MKFVRVALDVPLPTLFDYRADDAKTEDIGCRVAVPFGKRAAIGVVMEVSNHSELAASRLRYVQRFLRDVPPLPADVLDLIRFCANYYRHPIGEVAAAALPSRLRRPSVTTRKNQHVFRLTSAGLAADVSALPPRAAVKRRLMELLRNQPQVDPGAVRALSARGWAALKTLIDLGWVESCASLTPPAAQPLLTVNAGPGPMLNEDQEQALTSIRSAAGGFDVTLLHGATGSGKTEVYLNLIADTLAAGKQVLVLVPEINLTPQLEDRFRSRFQDGRLVSLHSHLSESERLQNWMAAQEGTAHIVLGTRLAVFAPMPRLGLIIVDEEHDPSFKQADGLRYSARDVAVLRAQLRAIPAVLGSATPALESYHNAKTGRYRMVALPRRASGAFPSIDCVDLRRQKLVDGFAPGTVHAIAETINSGGQTLVFINRRGFAPVLLCHQCGWVAECHRCTARLVVHLSRSVLRCHHCGHQETIVRSCPACGNQDLAPLGHGTQRLEQALRSVLPQARVLRIDRDTTRRKAAWPAMREQIREQRIDILVGTQMLAKGHDFPNLNLVCVLNADDLLFSTDFRAGERLFALLTQVAGRAGRGTEPGRVLIQTEFPKHILYRALRRHDFAAFADELLTERRKAGFPPFEYQALLRAEAPRAETALAFLEHAATLALELQTSVTVYDAVPATMARLAGVERAQLLVQDRSRTGLQAFLARWHELLLAQRATRVRWLLDVDPQEF